MKIRQEYICPLELTHDVIKGKWKPIILWNLKSKTLSLADLERSIEGVSQKMLLEHLKELVEVKMVKRFKHIGYPLKTDYSLTERGNKILNALTIMQEIGTDLIDELYPQKSK